MIVTSADRVQPHVQTVTTYAADFDEVQTIALDADDVDEWQYAYIDVARTVYESQVRRLPWVEGTTVSNSGGAAVQLFVSESRKLAGCFSRGLGCGV